MVRQINVIVDLQYGSCGKGLFAGYLAEKTKPDCVVTAWAPNAGHTYIDADGHKYVHTMLANGIVSPLLRRVLIGPGSVVHPAQLYQELTDTGLYQDAGVTVAIHENACVVADHHREAESKYGFRIGSTMKGVGEAVIEKIRRKPGDLITARWALAGTPLEAFVVPISKYNELLDASEVVQVEGAQGFSISMNQGFYPYTTSRDCTTHQTLSDCGIPRFLGLTQVFGVARTFPIRVANRFDGKGNQIGTSGPCYPDQTELDWESINRPPELTTVTKLPRRVFSFSYMQVREACRMNGVDAIFLNFANYLQPGDCQPINGVFDWSQPLQQMVTNLKRYAPVRWLGWGPTFNDVEEI